LLYDGCMQIAENERAQEQLPTASLMPATAYESATSSQAYDRNYLPVNLLESNHVYSRTDQTALQFV
jgi:MADS-box transcription factor